MVDTLKKRKIVEEFKLNDKDTGSSEVQVALLTTAIESLADHFKKHPKDYSSKRGMLKKVNQRKSFLKYLARTDENRYKALIQRLGIRK